jgi:hypothetical protein
MVGEDMLRTLTTLFLLLAFAFSLQAQKQGRWASARERSLRGVVRTVVSSCSDVSGKYETRYKYEYAPDGKLMAITSPQSNLNVHINSFPVSYKITKRNGSGEIEEVSMLLEGDVMGRERYEYEYDSVGNWIKMVRFKMRTYELAGGDWPAGEWRAQHVCKQMIEYYQ